jgi:predicted ATPase
MARVLITGTSVAGKSTLLAAVALRGLRTVDTDYEEWGVVRGAVDEPAPNQ